MQLSVSTAMLYPRPLAECLRLVRQVGVEEVELMPQDPSECDPALADFVSTATPRISSIHFPAILEPFLGNPYPSARGFARTLIDGLVDLAASLECRVIVVHPLRPSDPPIHDGAYVENLAYLCEECRAAGVRVGLENTVASPTASPDGLAQMLARYTHLDLEPVLDTTHARRSGWDPLVFLRRFPIRHVHLSDFRDGEQHVPLGTGDVRWEDVLGAVGADATLVLELRYRHCWPDAEQPLAASVAYLRHTLDKVRAAQ